MDRIVVKFNQNIAQTRGTRTLQPLSRDADLSPDDAAEISFSVQDVDDQQRAELDADPEYLVADKMDLSLIDPVNYSVGYDPVVTTASGDATWGVSAIGADQSGFDGQGVKVAVLDTGIDKDYATHPAFSGMNIVTKNFTNDVDEDNDGHGTHCAGTIFGRDVGGTRIGVAPGVTDAFIAKVIPGGTDALVDALTWAFNNDVRVASMSLGIDFPGFQHALMYRHGYDPRAATSRALTEYRANLAVFDTLLASFKAREFMDRGMVIVAATGNESKRPSYTIDAAPPSAAMGMVRVGAIEQDGNGGFNIANFSNTKPVVVAPGVDVESAALGGGTVSLSGTSMATPHVAGLAALYWNEAHPAAKASNIAAQLEAQARAVGLTWEDGGLGMAVAP